MTVCKKTLVVELSFANKVANKLDKMAVSKTDFRASHIAYCCFFFVFFLFLLLTICSWTSQYVSPYWSAASQSCFKIRPTPDLFIWATFHLERRRLGIPFLIARSKLLNVSQESFAAICCYSKSKSSLKSALDEQSLKSLNL